MLNPKRLLTVALGLLSIQPVLGLAVRADEFDALRDRAKEQFTSSQINAADADYQPAIKRMGDQASAWAGSMTTGTTVWTDVPLSKSDPSKFGVTLDRLVAITVAWATPGTPQYNNAAVAQKVVTALDQVANYGGFKAGSSEVGNWWYWEIGGPKQLATILLFLKDIVPADKLAAYIATIDFFCPNADWRTNYKTLRETGANRADKALILLYRGIVGKSADKIAAARDGLSDKTSNGQSSLFKYVTSGDGFYTDGSFVQHGYIAYTGTYGIVLLQNLATMMSLLGGSTWAITDPAASMVYDTVFNSFAPVIKDGLMMDTVRGRGVSRQKWSDRDFGYDAVAAILLLSEAAPADQKAQMRSLVKGWIQRTTTQTYFAVSDVAAIKQAKALLADSSSAAGPDTMSYVFSDMDRVVHRRAGWSYAISMNSNRIAPVEFGNGENLRGWYQGDGMTYLYNGDLDQFNDAFWPTVDSKRLPGTTVDTRDRADFTGGMTYARTGETWAGGAVLDSRFMAAGMSHTPLDVTLRARKSWFLFDDAVVALGAGINSTDGRAIETVIENRNLHAGGAALNTGPNWAHLDGTAGYVLLSAGSIQSKREKRSGTWRSINTGGDTAGDTVTQTKEYVTLWLNHGASPSNAQYAYATLPGADQATTQSWATTKPVEVLANAPNVQAVRHNAAGVTMANFFSPGAAGDLSADGPCSVVLFKDGTSLRIAISDPSRKATTVNVVLPFAVASTTSADSGLTVTAGTKGKATAALGGKRGHTLTAVVALA